MKRTGVAVLGASGSIGRSTAAELAAMQNEFSVVGLVGRNGVQELAQQSAQLHSAQVITTDPAMLGELQRLAPSGVRCLAGMDAVMALVTSPEVDVVLCAISGVTGVEPVLAALRAGKRVALASKEVLVMAGDLVMPVARTSKGGMIPVDSEHSGLFQCLAGRRPDEVADLVLTGSGGPFLHWEKERIARASVADALKHPTWSMGGKITIDSASLMNKALEVIEAHHLFGVPGERIKVLINPQSIVHALIELVDGTLLGQFSTPSMRLAIRYALTYPARQDGDVKKLDLAALGKLDFYAPDLERFPALTYAYESLRAGGTMPAVLNAANDVAVERFRSGGIPFARIWEIVERTMSAHTPVPVSALDELKAVDRWAREYARTL